MANLNNFNRLCSIGAVLACLGPGPRAIKAGVPWPRVWEPMWEMVGSVDLIGYSGRRSGQPLAMASKLGHILPYTELNVSRN